MSNSITPLTVYYDHSCPICREEIVALKSIDTNDVLIMVDCSSPDFNDIAAQEGGLTQQALKTAMHVRDVNGQWYKAINAFVTMYEAVGFDAAAALLQKRGLRPMFEWAYPLFVKHRYKLRFIGAHKLMPWLIRRATAKKTAKTASSATKEQKMD